MMIDYSAKGGVNVELKVDFDKAGHGSIPARESAITILTKGKFSNQLLHSPWPIASTITTQLKSCLKIQKALHNVATNPQPNLFGKSIEYYTFEGLTPYLPFPANVITANLWLFSPIVSRLASMDNMMNAFMRTTTAITIVDAGFKNNVIPTTARAIIDHRIHPGSGIQRSIGSIFK